MKKPLLSIVAVYIITIISGCSFIDKPKPQQHQTGVFVVWKTPYMKYADQGFLYEEPGNIKLEVYESGQAAMQIAIRDGKICSGNMCTSKSEFNKRYLSANYPPDIVKDILLGHEIMGGKNKKEVIGGFVQTIKEPDLYDIEYSVINGSVIFKDSFNNILIKITK